MGIAEKTCYRCEESTAHNPCPKCGKEQYCHECDRCNLCGKHPAEVTKVIKPPPKPKGEFFLVAQNGGSSGEWYVNAYDTREEAWAFINDCHKHTYNCVGPFSIPSPPDDCDWCTVMGDIIGDAVTERFAIPTETDNAEEDDSEVHPAAVPETAAESDHDAQIELEWDEEAEAAGGPSNGGPART